MLPLLLLSMMMMMICVVDGLPPFVGLMSTGGLSDREVDNFVLRALFSTVTNVNFDSARFNAFLKEAHDMKTRAKALYEKAKASASPAALAKAQAEEQQEDQWHPTAFKFHSVPVPPPIHSSTLMPPYTSLAQFY